MAAESVSSYFVNGVFLIEFFSLNNFQFASCRGILFLKSLCFLHMAQARITPRKKNFPQWYQDIIAIAPDLFDESPVPGCITFGPFATRLWDNIKNDFDRHIKALGVENIMLDRKSVV